jgi:DNA-binding IclR family transcriptional regulator
MSEEAQEQARLTLIPVPVAVKPRKASPRAMSVNALATFATGKERKEAYEAVIKDNRIHVILGATKDEVAKAYDANGALDVSGIDKATLCAGVAYRKKDKLVMATSSLSVSLIRSQLEKIEQLKEETGPRSKETREAIGQLAEMKEAA